MSGAVADRRIARMPRALAEAIAAGEVIERPASVVKELLENSLDAGAGEVEVRVLKGGKHLIEVTDDGRGIHPDDLPLAIERHASSKLSAIEDLMRIATFGFRGEALASLAAAGELVIESRAEGQSAGAGLKVEPGEGPGPVYPVARPRGTRIQLKRLFGNLPGRQKFLRTDRTELQRVRDMIKVFLLAHPEVGFRFYSGDKLVWNHAPAELGGRLAELFPDTPWLDVAVDGARLRLTGRLSHPHVHQGSGRNLHLFVNRRYVRDPLVRKAVQAGFERVIPPGRSPLGVLFVDVVPEDVDVNVHPAKTEVRFVSPQRVFAEVQGAIRHALTAGKTPPGAAAGRTPTAGPDPAPPGDRPAPQPQQARLGAASTPAEGEPRLPRTPVERWRAGAKLRGVDAGVRDGAVDYGDGDAGQGASDPFAHLDLVPLTNLGQRYLIYREGPDLVLVDQHAAHERVRYDRIIAALEGGGEPVQELLVPSVWQAEPDELEGFRRGGQWLARTGFFVEAFGPETLRVRAVPRWFRGEPERAVRETLRELAALPGSGEVGEVGRRTHDLAASLACKGAILSGRDVPDAEQLALLKHLLATPGAETCPHGRPTYRRMTPAQLDRWFGR